MSIVVVTEPPVFCFISWGVYIRARSVCLHKGCSISSSSNILFGLPESPVKDLIDVPLSH